MKRISAIFLAAAVLMTVLASLPFSVSADSEEYFEYTVSDGEATVTGYIGKDLDVTIPSILGGAPVTAIGEKSFYDQSNMRQIKIPDGVRVIGNYAFAGCYNLWDVILPDSVNTIGDGAFSGCFTMGGITFGAGLTSIGEEAFSDCYSMQNLTIPKALTQIRPTAFYGCGGLTKITVAQGNPVYHSDGNCLIETATGMLLKGCESSVIPEGVKTIGYGAFSSVQEMERIEIPESVATIEDKAFYAAHLKEIVIPKNVTKIGTDVFGYNSFLQSITVAEDNPAYYAKGNCLIETETGILLRGCVNSVITSGVKAIADRAFDESHDLSRIVIPEGVTRIGAYAFAGCIKLETVVIPSGVSKIGDGAFSGIYYLRRIFIPESVAEMGKEVFDGEGLEDIYCGSAEEPDGWDEAWLERYSNNTHLTVHWGSEGLPLSTGDIDGDGEIGATDYMLLKRAVLETYTLTEAQEALADINGDGEVNATDYMLLKRAVLGTYVIEQP